MNPVIELLLKTAYCGPLPAQHTSSFWQRYGEQAVVEYHNDNLLLKGVMLGSVSYRNPLTGIFVALHRMSQRHVTAPLKSYPEVWKLAKHLACELSFKLTFDIWKCAVALALLADHWKSHKLTPKTFALIGDGYGFFGALVRRYNPDARLYFIDLPKMLVFQARTCEIAHGAAAMSVFSADNWERTDITFVSPRDVRHVRDKIDCAVNIASMQEMSEVSIMSYFTFLRQRSTPGSHFYCVNRPRKELPGGDVTSFLDYPWQKDDEVFIDGPCPYYTHIVAPYTLPRGPKLLGVRVPFINFFDGIMMHRLVHLAPVS